MMNYDEKVPLLLKREQIWFGSIIGRPIDACDRMCELSPSGRPMEKEAAEHIVPGPQLTPAQRIQIYNQQYWWRLLKTLQEAFPLLLRLFGYFNFNRQIIIPYLVENPPNHWSLNALGDRLLGWLTENYKGSNKRLVCDSACLDWVFTHSFIAEQLPPLTAEQISSPEAAEAVSTTMLYAQPHVQLLQLHGDLFRFRGECLKHDPEYFLNNPLPALEPDKTCYFVVYRNARNEISWKEISWTEYHLLDLFKAGTTIEMACEWLEKQDTAIYETALNNLQHWFQEWSMRGWLSCKAES